MSRPCSASPRTAVVALPTRCPWAAVLTILANLVGLGGCAITAEQAKVQTSVVTHTTAPTPSQAEAQAALQRRITVCRSRYPAGYPHFLDKAHCDKAARRAALLASGTPADLADAYLVLS